MAENPETIPQDAADDDEALKKRLLSRIAIAGVMVVALLGGLAVIDALQKPAPEAPPESVATVEPTEKAPSEAPAPTEEKAAETPAATAAAPSEAAPAEAREAGKEAKPEVPAPPERTASAEAPPPSRQARPPRPLTVPATPRAAIMKPGESALAPQRVEPQTQIGRHAPASRPLSQPGAPTRQFVVQMGVFNNLANAEELRAKLELAGVPAQIEARVQVGPFATRQEADAAREKLRALGLETGILTAIKR